GCVCRESSGLWEESDSIMSATSLDISVLSSPDQCLHYITHCLNKKEEITKPLDTHTHTPTPKHTHTHTHTHTHVYTVYIHSHTDTHIYTLSHTHTHTHIHSHTPHTSI